ncbi:sodium/proline symporter [Candidatus Dependentiae bacterium]|nr:sodium/proline symporter [Candidatus Dependentiae bacterium]
MNGYFLVAFISYFAFFLGLSIYFYRKNSNANSFIMGDRSVNYWVTAIAAQASDMSDWLFMGYPGLIYGLGIFNVWVAIGLVLFMFLNWHFIAPRLRRATEKYQSLTLASFFERRFADITGKLRLLTVFFSLWFLCFYIAAELIGLGRLFESTFGLHYNVGIGLSIALVVANILIGGFIAAAWSDMFRGFFLLGMIVVVPFVASSHLGGVTYSKVVEAAAYSYPNISLSLIPDYSWATLGTILSIVMGWGLGYFGSPHILINFMGIKDPEKIAKAKYIGITWQILVLAAATWVGLVGIVFFPTALANRELVFVEMVKSLFHPLFAGFILCAILAATMSVMTAQILAAASIVSEDLFKRLFTKPLSPQGSLWLIRSCVMAIPVLSYAISYNNTSAVNDLVSYAWSGLGLAFAPVVISALYGSHVTKEGAFAGMLTGGLIGIIWPHLGFSFMPLLPGFIISLTIITLVSLATAEKPVRMENYILRK